MNAINAADVETASPLRSWVDHPAEATLDADHVVIRGWCYHRGGAEISGVRAVVRGHRFAGWYGDPRPDVRAMFGGIDPVGEQTGFEITAAFPAGPGECVLEASIAGVWTPFQRFQVVAPKPRRFADRLRWPAFWTRAWLGDPGAWSRLSTAERDYAVAWMRHRGWLNLLLAPQYAPRAVRPESFPKSRSPAEALPKLTVVTPSFQQAPFLEATMRSVLDQPGIRLEYIVQDGGSTDGSVDILRRHADRLARWESQPDSGQAEAIERGFAGTTGAPTDVMMYLNSDDLLMPGAARYALEYFARHPKVDVLYGHRVLIDEGGAEVGRWYTPRDRCDDLRLHDLIPQETLFWRRRIWDRVGGVDRSFHFALDWDLLLRFRANGARFARVPRFLGMFRLHPQQKSQAQIVAKGIPEMDRLRARTLGRVPTEAEMHVSMRRAQFDSAVLKALDGRGVRL